MTSVNYSQSFNNNTFDYIPAWNPIELPPESFLSFEEDDEIMSTTSGLNNGSKKISKLDAKKTTQKKSKRARNPWTPKEDAKLMELMKKYGQSWAMISSVMEGRTGKQVRDRFLNKLRPNIKCGDWSPEEDARLVALCKEVGNRWSLIATHLPGRTEGQVKNRFYSHIKKRLQPNGELSQTAASSRCTSEALTSSIATSPSGEERFDFTQELDFDMLNNGCTMNFAPNQSNCMIAKGPYVAEEMYSEQSTTQSPTSHSQSPFRVGANPVDVISYETPEDIYYASNNQAGAFTFYPIHHDSQVDEMLNGVTNYYQNPASMSISSDVDAFFADDLRSEERNSSVFSAGEDDERLVQLSKRKAFLELALAKTLKEIKGL